MPGNVPWARAAAGSNRIDAKPRTRMVAPRGYMGRPTLWTPYRRQLGGALAVQLGTPYGNVLERCAAARAPQHQAAPTHVAATDERRGKVQAVAEDFEQRLDVLLRGDAPEQHDGV